MKTKIILILLFITNIINAQISASKQTSLFGFIAAKEYSKDIALYNAKKFVVDEIIGISDSIVKFEIDPLAASNSGEVTTLVYKCEEKNKEGLIFGFYNDYWNNAGVIYSGYGFKALTKAKTDELLQKILSALDKNNKFIKDDYDNNNICFQFDDMTFIIYRLFNPGTIIRIFWNGFHAEWSYLELTK